MSGCLRQSAPWGICDAATNPHPQQHHTTTSTPPPQTNRHAARPSTHRPLPQLTRMPRSPPRSPEHAGWVGEQGIWGTRSLLKATRLAFTRAMRRASSGSPTVGEANTTVSTTGACGGWQRTRSRAARLCLAAHRPCPPLWKAAPGSYLAVAHAGIQVLLRCQGRELWVGADVAGTVVAGFVRGAEVAGIVAPFPRSPPFLPVRRHLPWNSLQPRPLGVTQHRPPSHPESTASWARPAGGVVGSEGSVAAHRGHSAGHVEWPCTGAQRRPCSVAQQHCPRAPARRAARLPRQH